MKTEMEKFRNMLDEAGIEWQDASEMRNFAGHSYMERTHFEHRGYRWSVIHGFGSYGGFDLIFGDKGLLELLSAVVNGGEPVGYLTAAQAMKLVKGEENKP